MEKVKPLMIVMTPVRNEAWVLHLFLSVTSRWADYIIVADQMSTDGSREIARSFPKVVLIDNDNPEFNEADRQAMLIAKAREVAAGRDCILWGLDADEIFDAHFQQTNDWKRICESIPGDVFFFQWAEVCPDKAHYWLNEKQFFPWMFHDDGVEPHGNYVRKMHSMRIPYPIEERQIYYANDFKVLHLAYMNEYRVASKRRFYTFVDWELNHRNPVTLSRSYAQTKKECIQLDLPEAYVYTLYKDGFDMWQDIDFTTKTCWMDDYVQSRIGLYSKRQIAKLDIWDDCAYNWFGQPDPRSMVEKAVHWYLHKTRMCSDTIVIRGIDKIIKTIY